MIELAVRVDVETGWHVNAADENGSILDVGVAAVVTSEPEFETKERKEGQTLVGQRAVYVIFKENSRTLRKDPRIEEAAMVEELSVGILAGEVSEEGGIGDDIRVLSRVEQGEVTATFVGVQAVAIALRELESRSGLTSPEGRQAAYIKKVIALALRELGPEAHEAMAELLFEFLGENTLSPISANPASRYDI